jgi:hypothetical protein
VLSWIGQHDAGGRPIFRGEKAYRVMYELRKGDIPDGFHVHHKCGNSACVNPRHPVALSAEAHRAVHATKDKALKESIYQGEWEQIQAAKAEVVSFQGVFWLASKVKTPREKIRPGSRAFAVPMSGDIFGIAKKNIRRNAPQGYSGS